MQIPLSVMIIISPFFGIVKELCYIIQTYIFLCRFLYLKFMRKNVIISMYFYFRRSNMANQLCIVLDFGGQYNQLIARRVRECGVYCEIKSYTTPIEEIKALDPMGIIFTGGPNSVYEEFPAYFKGNFRAWNPDTWNLLRLSDSCIHARRRGKQLHKSEYGKIEITHSDGKLFDEVPEKSVVWMSHTDYVSKLPDGFRVTATSADCPAAAFENPEKSFTPFSSTPK